MPPFTTTTGQRALPPPPELVEQVPAGPHSVDPRQTLPPVINGRRIVEIPFSPPGLERPEGTVNFSTHNGRITLVARDASLSRILGVIAEQHGLNIITTDHAPTKTTVTVTLTNVPLEDALNSILSVTGYTWSRQRDIITVSSLAGGSMSPMAQGRVVRLFPLNFTSARDVEPVVTGLMSPIGKVFVTETDSKDTRRTRETVVVEDIPEYVTRIGNYIREIDQPPRQVMIEAHVLQVDLTDTTEHGVNLQKLAQLAGTDIDIRTTGFASPDASPALLIGIDGGEVDGLRLIEALKATSDTKTLASPKVLALNGQEARIQIGGQLGFLQTTTTETATLQNVTFLEVGVVLTVTPYISDDGRILMKVKPEVSSGRINSETGLPEEETTEVETTVMLNDGQGMIIGGLIQEADEDDQSKVPLLGDAFAMGRLFQRRRVNRQRNEVIIALIPRVIPYDNDYQAHHDLELERATTPLLQGPLHRHPRPWEPRLPDACPEDNGVVDEQCPCPENGHFQTYISESVPPAVTPASPTSAVETSKPVKVPRQFVQSRQPVFGTSRPVSRRPAPKVVAASFAGRAAQAVSQPTPKLNTPPIIPPPTSTQTLTTRPRYRIPNSPRRHRR